MKSITAILHADDSAMFVWEGEPVERFSFVACCVRLDVVRLSDTFRKRVGKQLAGRRGGHNARFRFIHGAGSQLEYYE